MNALACLDEGSKEAIDDRVGPVEGGTGSRGMG